MILTADFETTTDPDDCRVWAYGICEVGNPSYFTYGTDLDDFIEYMKNSKNSTFYFHNLKFDGDFLMSRLFNLGYTYQTDRRKLKTKTFTSLISDQGQFYSIKIVFKKAGHKTNTVTIYDSLKVLPFSVKVVAKSFNLPISKLEMDYDLPRPVGYVPTPAEISYIRNDVDICARALFILFEQGLTKMTVGSNALYDFKGLISGQRFDRLFPSPLYDAEIRKSYKGGFTWLNPKFKGHDVGAGIVLDVNSLYPSVMRDKPLPYGEGIPFHGRYKPDTLYPLYVQQLRCQFELKPNHIPTIQIKNSLRFVPTEYLTSSDEDEITLTLTSVDLELFFEHYEVYNIEYLDGWMFKSATGIFAGYVDKWGKLKKESSRNGNAGMKTIAKLMLNSLYGKFALNPNVSSKIPNLQDGVMHYAKGEEDMRIPLYIPVGTFITSWARHITITAAQQVYDRFIYADTDSLHLIGTELPDLPIDDYELGYWGHESTFSKARFIRAKSYMELGRDPKYPEKPETLNIVCAGLPDSCHPYVTWDNFKTGTVYPGKLQMTHVKGGIVLKEIEFTLQV